MHGPEICENIPDPKISPPDRERGRPTKLGHPIQDVARDQRFSVLSLGVPSTKPVANEVLAPVAVDRERGRNDGRPVRVGIRHGHNNLQRS